MAEIHEKLPLLMSMHGEHRSRQSFYSLVDRQCKKTQLRTLIAKRIIGSGHGWLVLVNFRTGDSCLWNPESMRQVTLPCLNDAHLYDRCVLSGPPTDPDCHVIFCTVDSMEWTVFRVKECTTLCSPPGQAKLIALASLRGEMYGVVETEDEGYEFVTVHVVNGGLELRPLLDELGQTLEVPFSRRKSLTLNESHLIEAPGGGGLLLVMKLSRGSIFEGGVDFKVFRVEVAAGRQMECVELESVDEWTIFVNNLGNSFCRISEKGVCRPNSVYYTDEIGRAVKVYDLGERSTTVLMPFRYAGRYVSLCYWVDIPDIPEPEPDLELELEPEPEVEQEP